MTTATLDLVVDGFVDAGPVRTLSLVADRPLPAFVPGSHLVLDCAGRSNAYSLLDDGVMPERYRISVLHQPGGNGGSRWVHALQAGDPVSTSTPRSAFAPVAAATNHLLIAGGIGVTPLLSHARAARRWGRRFTFLYRHRAGAHLDELRELCGPRLVECTDRPAFARQLSSALVCQPLGTHLYVCGPAAFTEFVLQSAREAGWPANRVHLERFSGDQLDAGRPLRVRVGDNDYDVPSGVSVLETLERHGHVVPFRCRQGVCGECLLVVLAGRVEHRDLFLSDVEREAGDRMLPCVSRAVDDDVLEVVLA